MVGDVLQFSSRGWTDLGVLNVVSMALLHSSQSTRWLLKGSSAMTTLYNDEGTTLGL